MATALITIADLENHVGPGIDAFSNEQITDAVEDTNEAVEEYCNRVFLAATYREWVDVPQAAARVYPRGYPVTMTYRVASPKNGIKIQYTDSAVIEARVTIQAGKLVLVKPDATSVSITLSSYGTLALLEAQIETNANWEAEVVNEGIPVDLRPLMAGNALAPNYVTLEVPGEPIEVRQEGERCLVKTEGRFPTGPKAVFEHYDGGYAQNALPRPLIRAVLDVAADMLYTLARDPGVETEAVEGFRFRKSDVEAVILRHAADLKPWRNELET